MRNDCVTGVQRADDLRQRQLPDTIGHLQLLKVRIDPGVLRSTKQNNLPASAHQLACHGDIVFYRPTPQDLLGQATSGKLMDQRIAAPWNKRDAAKALLRVPRELW